MAVATVVIMILMIGLLFCVTGTFFEFRHKLKERRERRRAARDEESVVTIDLAVRRPPDIAAGREESRRLSGETVCAARNS